jgi:hypothetical protein
MADFNVSRDRDAYHVVRGYRYQIDLTILRWLKLKPQECLELERGEDIDLVNGAVTGSNEGLHRTVEQVKHLSRNLTLRSDECLSAIANAVEHSQHNPDLKILFRFSTNADPVAERPSPYDDRVPAIMVWEGLRQGTVVQAERLPRLRGIRSVLFQAAKPARFNAETWEGFRTFVTSTAEPSLLEFIRGFEWSTGTAECEDIETSIHQSLVASELCTDVKKAQLLFCRLFLHVVRLISQPGVKRLDQADLVAQGDLPDLSAEDQEILGLINDRVLSLERRVTAVEAIVEEHGQALASLNQAMEGLAESYGLRGTVSLVATPLSKTAPMRGPLVAARQRTVDSIITAFASKTWMAFHGCVGSGKTQLSMLIADAMPGELLWGSFRGDAESAAENRLLWGLRNLSGGTAADDVHTLVRAAIAVLTVPMIVVLDDLPRVSEGTRLSALLVELADAAASRTVKLLSSSHYPLPAGLLDLLPEGQCEQLPVPPFSDKEAAELFAVRGAPDNLLLPDTLSWLNGCARCHPTLLVAIAQYLSQTGWRLQREQIEGLTRWEHAVDVSPETVRRLLETVDDGTARDLLYRLCLAIGEFDRNDVVAAAAAPPPIAKPQERLNDLYGRWVQPEPGEMMSVSPLVVPLSATEQSAEVQKGVNHVLAERVLSQRTYSVVDLAKAFHYLCRSDNHNMAAVLLVKGFSEVGLSDAHRQWLRETCPYENLEPHAELGVRIYLLALQARFVLEIGGNAEPLLRNCEELVDAADGPHAWGVVIAAVMLLPQLASIDFSRSVRLQRAAIDAYPRIRIGERMLTIPDESLGSLVWFNAIGIRTCDDLLAWVATLERLPAEDRQKAFGSFGADLGCRTAMDRPWMRGHELGGNRTDWRQVSGIYERVVGMADGLHLPLLWATAVRARVIVLASYCKDLDAGLHVAKNAMSQDILDPTGRFLIAEAMGRQLIYAEKYEEAQPWLEQARFPTNEADVGLCYRARIELSKAFGHEDPARAIEEVEGAVEIVRAHPQSVADTEMAIAVGELGIAKFLAGDKAGAFACMDEAADRLLACENDSVDWKQLVVMFGHTLSYQFSVAAMGVPPDSSWSGEAYSPPYRGIFLTYMSERVSFYNTDLRETLYVLLAGFAEAVGNDDRCRYWALAGLEIAHRSGLSESIGTLGSRALPTFVVEDRLDEAVDLALEFCAAAEAIKVWRDQGKHFLKERISLLDALGQKPNEHWNLAEFWAIQQGVIPCLFRIGTVALSDHDRAMSLCDQLAATCERQAQHASNDALWRTVRDMLRNIADPATGHLTIHERGNEGARTNNDFLYVLGYLGVCLKPDAPLIGCAINQVMVMAYVSRSVPINSGVYRRVILPFIEGFWQKALEQQRFRFTTPRLIADTFADAVKKPPQERAAAILRVIMPGLGTRLPQEAEKAREWLQGTKENAQ